LRFDADDFSLTATPQGVPLRIELGPKDMDNSCVMFARRDTGVKSSVSWADLVTSATAMMTTIQADMLAKATAELQTCTEKVTTWEEFMGALDRRHMALAPWADEEEIEEDIRKRSASAEAMGAKSLCIPFEQPELPEGTLCFASGKPAKNWCLFGRSY